MPLFNGNLDFCSLNFPINGDDDYLISSTQTVLSTRSSTSDFSLHTSRVSKKPKLSPPTPAGKENIPSTDNHLIGFKPSFTSLCDAVSDSANFCEGLKSSEIDLCCSLDSIQPSIVGCSDKDRDDSDDEFSGSMDECKRSKINEGYLCNSIESRLMKSRDDYDVSVRSDEFEANTELDLLLNLHSQVEEEDYISEVRFDTEETDILGNEEGSIQCPLCGVDISHLSNECRQVHTNECIDKEDVQAQNATLTCDRQKISDPQQSDDSSRPSAVLKWLHDLGLSKYEGTFVREEIDWDSLQWLTDEDLFNMGITALGPRRKITHALSELRKGSCAVESCMDSCINSDIGQQSSHGSDAHRGTSEAPIHETNKAPSNKLITDYFLGSSTDRKKACTTSSGQQVVAKKLLESGQKSRTMKRRINSGKLGNIPIWSCIPGTPFRVDAFRHLRGDCFHWFLTHFHMDHYQGLTKSFCHGMIYCSPITARLVNMKIGIPLERLQVLPLNQKINIAGTDITCFDANHCPGSIIILFEPPNGKAVLHTGDFRYCDQMGSLSVFQLCRIHTLILDTTYCNPQYDFPKQETVIQFVIDAIQAEAFNPKTLFLIGCYTIGKERLFLEVARVLRKKIYVSSAKLRILKCLELSEEDMRWFTVNERESHIHVVPLWTLASFKRLKHVANQYANRFSLIVAISPTGWALTKGKKKSPGKRSQQGTIIRYEVPYSEHSSFSELKDFVKLVSPANIIPSVNNHGPDSARAMVSLLLS